MRDLRIYTNTGIYEGTTTDSEMVAPSPVTTAPVSRFETIAGKVVKFMLTTIGSDATDPTYGSYMLTYTQIAEKFIPRFQVEIKNDLARCSEYIRKSEANYSSDVEKFAYAELKDIKYDRDLSPNRIDIYILVVTSAGNSSVLSVPYTTK